MYAVFNSSQSAHQPKHRIIVNQICCIWRSSSPRHHASPTPHCHVENVQPLRWPISSSHH
ncbi:hypothetical protein B0H12DRAFT_1131187 [Mycena haematopus]|nr:hypothetical protein B0H12DRAFT_1131187 [Mycena haematopus]